MTISPLIRASKLIGASLFGGFWRGAKIPHVWVALGAAALSGHVNGHGLASRGVALLQSDVALLNEIVTERNAMVAQLRLQLTAASASPQAVSPIALISTTTPATPAPKPRRPLTRPASKTPAAPVAQSASGWALPWPFN